jgi:hypothetical protein
MPTRIIDMEIAWTQFPTETYYYYRTKTMPKILPHRPQNGDDSMGDEMLN